MKQICKVSFNKELSIWPNTYEEGLHIKDFHTIIILASIKICSNQLFIFSYNSQNMSILVNLTLLIWSCMTSWLRLSPSLITLVMCFSIFLQSCCLSFLRCLLHEEQYNNNKFYWFVVWPYKKKLLNQVREYRGTCS